MARPAGGLSSVEETRPTAVVGGADVAPAVDCDTATVAAGTRMLMFIKK